MSNRTYQVLAEDLARQYKPFARDAISRLSPDVVLPRDSYAQWRKGCAHRRMTEPQTGR
jgi:hypothetical protein